MTTTVGKGRTGIGVADFLLDRYDEDHAAAWGAAPSPWTEGQWDGSFDGPREVRDRMGHVTARCYYGGTHGFVMTFDPSRILRGIEAKREAVMRCAGIEWGMPSQYLAFSVLNDLAAEYKDHPDYREEWRS